MNLPGLTTLKKAINLLMAWDREVTGVNHNKRHASLNGNRNMTLHVRNRKKKDPELLSYVFIAL